MVFNSKYTFFDVEHTFFNLYNKSARDIIKPEIKLIILSVKNCIEVTAMNKYDLIVVGGGFAGVGATIAAARKGLSVLLVEKSNCLGGAASNSLVIPFGGFFSGTEDSNGNHKFYSAGIFREIIGELKKFGGNSAIQDEWFNEEYLKLILNRMVLESGAKILFHARLFESVTEDGKVKSIKVATKSGVTELFANYFIDTTGDADLAAFSGFPFQLGREKDGLCQGMTLCFRVCNVDTELFKKERDKVSSLYHKYWTENKLNDAFGWILAFPYIVSDGILHFNSTRVVKRCPVDPFELTKAEIEAREMVFVVFDFLKKNCESFKNASLTSTASEIGVRESRKIIGEYILTGEDLINLKRFPDTVAVGNFDIDIHSPSGTGNSHRFFEKHEYYDIPYRSLIPKDSKNLLVAGRCISVTHEAQAAIRVMPIVCCLGEAAGLAAAIANQDGCFVKNVSAEKLKEYIFSNGGTVEIR